MAVLRDMATSLKAQGFTRIFLLGDIMNDNPEYVRLQQRIDAGKASINGISILPVEQTIEHGRKLIEFRTRVTVEAIRGVVAGGVAGPGQSGRGRAEEATPVMGRGSAFQLKRLRGSLQWALLDSNQRPPACKAGALDQLS